MTAPQHHDPSGIGVEVIARALATAPAELRRDTVVISDRDTMERAARAASVDRAVWRPTRTATAFRVDHLAVDGLPGRFGVLDPACGEAASIRP